MWALWQSCQKNIARVALEFALLYLVSVDTEIRGSTLLSYFKTKLRVLPRSATAPTPEYLSALAARDVPGWQLAGNYESLGQENLFSKTLCSENGSIQDRCFSADSPGDSGNHSICSSLKPPENSVDTEIRGFTLLSHFKTKLRV
eukprot:scaffold58720_cov39-Cyclotella_meneghiniana.AAC.1